MGITLRELSDEGKQKYRMSLKAGKHGLVSNVTWVHTIEQVEVANFLHGGELIFTTGIANQGTQWLMQLVEELHQANAVGLVINTGPFIDGVAKEVVDLCDSLNFPVFVVPWEVRLVDVTKDFCDKIIQNNKREESIGDLFKNYVHNRSNDAFVELKNRGFDLNGTYLIYGFKIESPDGEYQYEERLKINLHQIFVTLNLNFAYFGESGVLYYIIEDLGSEQESLLKEEIRRLSGRGKIRSYVSKHDDNIFNLSDNYVKLNTLINSKLDGNLVSFDELGIERILLGVTNKEDLRWYYRSLIGPLIEYDRQNKTEFYPLLESYIENNGSLQQVANEFYLHKNTINYQLKKISQIIGMDISDFGNRVQLSVVFKIEKILTSS